MGWGDAVRNVTWTGAPGLWSSLVRSSVGGDGVFVTQRTRIVSFVLDGEMTVHQDGRELGRLGSGGAVVADGQAGFAYRLEPGSALLVLDPGHGPGIEGLSLVQSRHLSRNLARKLASIRRTPNESALRAVTDGASELGFAPATRPDHPAAARLRDLKLRLETSYTQSPSIGAWAQAQKLDPSYVSRAFARVYGVSPKGYLQLLRTERFLRNVLATRRELQALAAEAGFGDYPSASRMLKSKLGVSPNQLRKQQECPSGPWSLA